jgi:hypothetical protein
MHPGPSARALLVHVVSTGTDESQRIRMVGCLCASVERKEESILYGRGQCTCQPGAAFKARTHDSVRPDLSRRPMPQQRRNSRK